MKKDLLENIEETREKRKLTKEAKKKIRARLRANFFVFLAIALLIIAYVCVREYLPYEIATCTYDICAVICLIFNIIIVEVAYKKNSVKLIITGLEICAISVFSLFSTYVYYKLDYITISLGIICASAVYYIIKIIVISIIDRKKYLYEMSDFSEIIRKESKDKNAVYEQENRMKVAMEERRKLMENVGKTNAETENVEETVKPKNKKGKTVKTEKTKTEEILEPEKTIASKTAEKETKGSIARRGRRKKTETVQEVPEEPIVKKTSTRGRKPIAVKEEAIEEKPKAKKTTTAKTKKEKEDEVMPKTKKTTTTTKKATTSTKKTATKTTTATKKPVAKTSTAKKTTTKRTTKK